MENLFTISYRDVLLNIFKRCDPASLFTLRKCDTFLHEFVKEKCYERKKGRLFVNSKPIGWDKDHTVYVTDEYSEYHYTGIINREYNDHIFVKYTNGDIFTTCPDEKYKHLRSYLYSEHTKITCRLVNRKIGVDYSQDIYEYLTDGNYLVISYFQSVTKIYTINGVFVEYDHVKDKIFYYDVYFQNSQTKRKGEIDRKLKKSLSEGGAFAYDVSCKNIITGDLKKEFDRMLKK